MGTDRVADVVADVVATTRRRTAVYSRNRFHAPWGIAVPAGQLASVHVVTAGACWLVPAGAEPVRLATGDVVLVPSGLGHALVDAPGSPTRPLSELVGGPLGQTPTREIVIDGPGPVTGLLCGGYELDPGFRPALLPPLVHIGSEEAGETALGPVVRLLADEVDRADPGAAAVIASLVELLFVYVLRAWFAREDRCRALYDPVAGGALALIHADPGRPWTVVSLARAVGVPRATFSRRFTVLTGQPPMAYVTTWRMAVAARLLREERQPLREIARRVGYDSEFAFARAFKRTVGHAPGRYRGSSR